MKVALVPTWLREFEDEAGYGKNWRSRIMTKWIKKAIKRLRALRRLRRS